MRIICLRVNVKMWKTLKLRFLTAAVAAVEMVTPSPHNLTTTDDRWVIVLLTCVVAKENSSQHQT